MSIGESASLLAFRERNLEDLVRARGLQRHRLRDTLRCGLVEEQQQQQTVSVGEVEKLCNRIKRRKHADESDLERLSRGFLSSAANITAFVKVPGALNVLIKELTGSSGEKQVLAAEAICNLSLGDSGSCSKIAKQIAAYLLTLATSQNYQVAETSLWIMYNLMVDNEPVLDVFLAHKVDWKLRGILESNVPVELKREATKCLTVVMAKPLGPDSEVELTAILSVALKNWTSATPGLMYELLPRLNYQLADQWIDQLIQHLAVEKEGAQQLYSIRILGNLASQRNGPGLMALRGQLVEKSRIFIETFNGLLQQPEGAIYRETIWCLGNILSAFVEEGEEEREGNSNIQKLLLEALVVPRRPEYEFSQYAERQAASAQVMEAQ